MVPKNFAEMIDSTWNQLRGVENGQNDKCSNPFMNRLAKAAEETGSTALKELAEQLRQIRREEGATIDLERGLEPKMRSGKRKRITTDATPLEGEWWFALQTIRYREEAQVLEAIEITVPNPSEARFEMRNLDDSRWLKLEKPAGEDESTHFPWEGEGQVTVEHWVTGQFSSTSAAVRVTGTVWVKLTNHADIMIGNWVGVSEASERTVGLLVIAKSEVTAWDELKRQVAANPDLPYYPPNGI